MHREVFIIIGAMVMAAAVIFAAKPMASDCKTIRSGEIIGTNGDPVTMGSNDWGYNFQAHRFSGEYCLANELEKECPPGEPYLKMRWNDAFLSNKDCDGDSRLDTHYGYPSYKGSGAWLLMELSGEEDSGDGSTCSWELEMELFAIPFGAVLHDGLWMTPDGEEIGIVYDESFLITEVHEANSCTGEVFDYKSKYKTNVKPEPMPKNMPKEHPVRAAKR
ncbi:hypothetical protein JXA12_00960 [Candidatus Woesearchaeota archaeon]|nr:hypothetical protein [Candidatus Woesearchaeota archaeon]